MIQYNQNYFDELQAQSNIFLHPYFFSLQCASNLPNARPTGNAGQENAEPGCLCQESGRGHVRNGKLQSKYCLSLPCTALAGILLRFGEVADK